MWFEYFMFLCQSFLHKLLQIENNPTLEKYSVFVKASQCRFSFPKLYAVQYKETSYNFT